MAKINYKSDFDFILTLRDAQGNDIGFPDFDWEARFWTFSPMHAVAASCRGGKCEGCFNDNDKIHIVVNAPALGCGRLHAEVVTHHKNDIYPDGERTVYTPDALDIELVPGRGDAQMSANAGIVVPTAAGTKVLPRIGVRVCSEGYIEGDKETNQGRTYLRLLNAQPYLDAGYKPVLLHKCVRNRAYRQKGGGERWVVRTKGWHIRGSQETLRLTAIQPVGGNTEHIVAITRDENFVNGEGYSLNAIGFVKPHSPYYPDGTAEEFKYANDIVVSWGSRPVRIYDDGGGDDGEGVLHSPVRFKFGIAFQKDSDYAKTQRNLPTSDIVSNIAAFSVEFNAWLYHEFHAEIYSEKKAATVADYYAFKY